MENQKSLESIIMAALCTLTPHQLTSLIHSISANNHRYHQRIFSLITSPALFSLTLHRLNSLSLHHKSLLISRHLLLKLAILTCFMQKQTFIPPLPSTNSMSLRDLDSVLLLLLLCELRQHDLEALNLVPPSRWRNIICEYIANNMLKLSNIESSNGEVIIKCIEQVAKCKNFVNFVAYNRISGSVVTIDERKNGKKMAASVAAVVALPSVEVSGGGRECVICTEEMKRGRDVCKLPCDHLFHWQCILPWFKKMDTCPCCRFQLPSDNVLSEIQRLWKVLTKVSGAETELEFLHRV